MLFGEVGQVGCRMTFPSKVGYHNRIKHIFRGGGGLHNVIYRENVALWYGCKFPTGTDWTRLQWAFHDCTPSSTCSGRVRSLHEGGDAVPAELLWDFLLYCLPLRFILVLDYIPGVPKKRTPGLF